MKDDDGPLCVAIVHAADEGRGAEANTASLRTGLAKLGHDVRLYVGSKLSTDPDIAEISRFRCVPGVLRMARALEDRLGWQYVYHPWFRRLDRVMPSDVDVVHFHSLWSGRLGFADVGGLPRLTRRYPSLMTLQDMWMLTGHCACPAVGCERWKGGCGACPDLTIAPSVPVDGTAFNWARKRRNMRRSRLTVTTVSDWLAQQVAQSPIFHGKQVCTVYNGVDREIFYPRSKHAARTRLGLPTDVFVVMMAGQSVEALGAGGNQATALALSAMSASQIEPFALVVGHSSEAVRDRWGGDGVAVPFQTDPGDLAWLYAAADVVLVTSTWETFGRVAAEAQMCGVAVVAVNSGGLPEVILNEETGLVVDFGDPIALGAGLRRLFGEPAMRRQFGVAAVDRARRLFSNEVIANQYVGLYRQEIRSRGRAGVA